MKKVLCYFASFVCLLVVFASCEKTEDSSTILEGDYVCQKVEIAFTDGSSRTITDKEEWVRKNDDFFSSFEDADYILFEYEFVFEDGMYKFKADYTDDLISGGGYSVKNNLLYLVALGFETSVYKIVSSSRNSLVLEATEDYIDLANFSNELYGANLSIKKTTATYKRR